MRVLGVDFGFRRIGIAVGETEPRVASARPQIPATGSLERNAAAIAEIAEREGAKALVLGVPRNPEGDDRMERLCLRLSDRLRALGWDVELIDESLSTVQAEQTLANSGLKAASRKRIRDSEAARIILERYFDGLP